MPRTVEFSQKVVISISHPDTYEVPQIRDEFTGKLRIIRNPHLVKRTVYSNARNRFRNSIFAIKRVMEDIGWEASITHEDHPCHQHLRYRYFSLRCWK